MDARNNNKPDSIMQNPDKVLQAQAIAFLPVTLAMPPENEPVLGYADKATSSLNISTVMHDGEKWGYVFPDEPTNMVPILNDDCVPTHWAPMPKPKHYSAQAKTILSTINRKSPMPNPNPITDPDAFFPTPNL